MGYRELAEQIERLSGRLRSVGLKPAIKLQEFCRERLADFKVPKFIHITSAMPKNVMGKIKRRDVAAPFKEFKAPGAVR